MCGETKVRGQVKIITVALKQWVSFDIKGTVRKWIHVKNGKKYGEMWWSWNIGLLDNTKR